MKTTIENQINQLDHEVYSKKEVEQILISLDSSLGLFDQFAKDDLERLIGLFASHVHTTIENAIEAVKDQDDFNFEQHVDLELNGREIEVSINSNDVVEEIINDLALPTEEYWSSDFEQIFLQNYKSK